MMSKNFGLIVTAIVAVVAIIGLVINFTPSSATGAAQTVYVPLQGYPSYQVEVEDTADFIELGEALGDACLSWTTDQQKCCAVSCGAKDVCPKGECFNLCKTSCQDTIKEFYGYKGGT